VFIFTRTLEREFNRRTKMSWGAVMGKKRWEKKPSAGTEGDCPFIRKGWPWDGAATERSTEKKDDGKKVIGVSWSFVACTQGDR